MKAYIKTFEEGNGFKAEVVTEQDYHERGPFARSYLSPWSMSQTEAFAYAWGYATANRLMIVEAHENLEPFS